MLYLFMERTNQPKKKRSEWTDEERLEVARLVFDYLKHDPERDVMSDKKRTLPLTNGRTIQYVDRFVTQTINDVDYGYEDTIVYVGESICNGKSEKTFLNTGWVDVSARFHLLDTLSDKTLEEVVFAVTMHKGLYVNRRV